MFALVQADGRWYVLYGPEAGANLTLQALSPAGLPSQIIVLLEPAPRQDERAQPTTLHLSFLAGFLPYG